MIPEPAPPAQTRYCALEYRSPDSEFAPLDSRNIVLLLLALAGQPPLVLLNPQWRNMARAADHDYIEELYRDFCERIRVDTEGLFAQASDLAVGPLVTHCSGRCVENLGWLRDLRERFAAC